MTFEIMFSPASLLRTANPNCFPRLQGSAGKICLLYGGRKELNPKTLPRIRQWLLPSDNHILVYYQSQMPRNRS
jgi:hypothetical protein